MQVYVDKHPDSGNKEILVKAINPLDLYIDPASRDPHIRDAAHVLVSKIMTAEQVKAFVPKINLKKAVESADDRYPSNDRNSNEQHEILPTSSEEGSRSVKRYEVIERYTKLQLNRFNVYCHQDGMEEVFLEDEYETWKNEPVVAMKVDDGEVQWMLKGEPLKEALAMVENLGPIYHFDIDEGSETPTPVSGKAPAGSGIETVYSQIVTKNEAVDEGVYLVKKVKLPRIKRVLSIGGLLASQSLLECGDYPIVTIMNRHNRNPYPISDVRFVKPIQEQINKYESLILAHASNSTNTKVFIPKGGINKKQLEEEWSRAGTAVIEYDPEFGQPIVAGPIPMPNELYTNVRNLKESIYHILGVYPLGQGDVSSAPQTYKGTVAIDEFAQRRMKSKIDDIESFLNAVARVVVHYIPKVYQEHKIIQLLRPNNVSKSINLNQNIYDDVSGAYLERMNDVTVGSYDIVVVSGSTLPSNRWARFEGYKEMFSMGLIDQVEVLKQTEVVDMEGVLQRMSMISQMQEQMKSMDEEIKNLKGDLQTAERASVNDRKRLEVEKFKSKLKEVDAKTKASAELFDARLKDELSNTKSLVAESKKDNK